MISNSKQFSIIYNIINPVIAGSITYFFVFLLQDLLLMNFLFQNEISTVIGFISLIFGMILISMIIPPVISKGNTL